MNVKVVVEVEVSDEFVVDAHVAQVVAVSILRKSLGNVCGCVVLEPAPRTISDELRNRILKDQDFLKDFAVSNFMYDGLEYDHAAALLGEVSDDDLCDEYCCHGGDEEIVAELKKVGKYGGEMFEKLGLGENKENS